MRLFTYTLVCILCLGSVVFSQQGLKRFNIQEPTPIISLSADINRYWNVETESTDSVPQIVREHYEGMERGTRYSFRLGYHFSDLLSFGIHYAYAFTAHTTPEEHWLINGINRYGAIGESIYQNYYGFYLEKYIEINRDYQIGIGLSPGIVSFVRFSDFAGLKQTLEGQDLAIDIYVDGLYTMDQNWSLYVRGSFYNSTIVEPLVSGPHFPRRALPNNPINISYFRLGAGIRYTFVQQ